ncbi:MAG: hypothetical protein H0W74_14125 [Sphingosinicella sp.]|nr:hypothetical protein [Sphingosinicella sp.]
MPLTYTGRIIKPGGQGHPSLTDIAISLSRQPRFAGHCRRWWSVLDHTLFGDDLLSAMILPAYRLSWLLHDAHESITGDVPTDFKSEGLKLDQQILDTGIHQAFMPHVEQGWITNVRVLDKRCLLAEAYVVGPPMSGDHLPAFGWTREDADQLMDDVVVLGRGLNQGKYLGIPPVAYPRPPIGHSGVKEYLSRMMELL